MFAGVFDEFFGVPTHPIAVHAPVVLVPIVAVVAVVLAVRSDWRSRIGWLMPAAVFVLVATLFVAKESGESLLDLEGVILNGTQSQIAEHQELADTTFVLAIVWFVLALALAIRDWLSGRDRPVQALSADAAASPRDTIALVLAIGTAVAAVVTTVWLIRTGHVGAESHWPIVDT